MTAIPFDALKFVRTLRDKAKFTPEQAEGVADAMAEALHDDLATKADLNAAKTELRTDICEQGTRQAAALREAELRLEAKIEGVKADLVKWMFGTIGFQTLIILGAVVALAKPVHP